MNSESKINIHYSSLVGLKTELLRKQIEVEVAKSKQKNFKLFNKICKERRKTKKLEGSHKLNELENIESLSILQKSKSVLKTKSDLYEKLSKIHINMNPNFLVDFKHKSDDVDIIKEEYQKVKEYKNVYEFNHEWIEYTDCFGRTRTCVKEDLPNMQEKDEFIKETIKDRSYDETKNEFFYVQDKLPKIEPEIEMMRKKWEGQIVKLSDKINIHYEDVLFDEARTHGVGYYAFSQDEEKRTKQQENLLNLRKQTEQKQYENKEITNTKDKLQQNRLKVAKLRQRIRTQLHIKENKEETDIHISKMISKSETNTEQDIVLNNKKNQSDHGNESNNFKQNIENSNNKQNTKQKVVQNKLIECEKKIQAFGQLLGKRNHWYVMSQEEWIHKKRKERIEEFGPIYQNSNNENKYGSNIRSMIKSQSNSILNPNESNIIESSLTPNQFCNLKSSKTTKEVISQNFADTNVSSNITFQVEAGLKYLRKQFENKHI